MSSLSTEPAADDHDRGQTHPVTPNSAPGSVATPPSVVKTPTRKMGPVQKVIVAILLSVVLIPPTAGFFSFFSGVPLHLLMSSAPGAAAMKAAGTPLSLVAGQAHTLNIPDDVQVSLGMHNGDHLAVIALKAPETMPPLVLPGSTALDPTRLARVRARFAPARVVELGKAWEANAETGHTAYRELRPGDVVAEGDLLGVFYSVDVGSKKTIFWTLWCNCSWIRRSTTRHRSTRKPFLRSC